jgi:hypothetical protein
MPDTMKGRHNVGGKLASPGKIRKGGSEPASNKVTTGPPSSALTSSIKPKAPVLANQAATSLDLQKRLVKPPQPFTNPTTTPNVSAGTGPKGAVPGLEPKIRVGLSGNSAPKNPTGAAVGYSKLPNQSGQIGGRNSYPPPARKAGSFPSGFKAKKNASFYGEN